MTAIPDGPEKSAGGSAAVITPDPTDEEAAAIVAAVQLMLSSGGEPAPTQQPSRWRFSGRWWSKPVPIRRARPG